MMKNNIKNQKKQTNLTNYIKNKILSRLMNVLMTKYSRIKNKLK